MNIQILKDEFWYGGCVRWSCEMPMDTYTEKTLTLNPNPTPNQGMPLLLSSCGRYLWMPKEQPVAFTEGQIVCEDTAILKTSGTTLRSAYLAAQAEYFPASGKMPNKRLFTAPIFNTWIELTYYQNQEEILKYAQNILDNGFQPGVLMIDDGWTDYYGCWKFHTDKFPEPRKMLKKLKEMGFTVMMWICPYISPDTLTFRQARDKNLILMTAEGKPYLVDWWNGFSASWDLSNTDACKWLNDQLQELVELGVDGFKFDGGDASHWNGCYTSDGRKADANELCRLWTVFGEQYPLNEFRAAWRAGGKPLMERLCDKAHSWGTEGVAALIPDMLAQGILGSPYGCPDMIGGGEYRNFWENADRLDQDLFVKHAGAGCLAPSIQFSAAPWRILEQKYMDRILAQLELRKKYQDYLNELLTAAATGEPVIRYMEYEFPHMGYEKLRDQFMLGSRVLVAPVLEKDQVGRQVTVPAGTWDFNGKAIESKGETLYFEDTSTCVIVLERK